MVLLDGSRGMHGHATSSHPPPCVPPSTTVAEMLEAAETAVEKEFAEQSVVIMKLQEQRASALSEVVTGAFRNTGLNIPVSSSMESGVNSH